MKRTAQLQRKPFARPSAVDPKTGKKRYSTFTEPVKGLARTSGLTRTAMKRKPRRPKPGDDKKYLAFVRKQVCCVGGTRCKKASPHHAIEMGGQQERGMGLTAPDSETLALCSRHHRQFHLRQGFCKGWSDERRRVFQSDEISRLRQMWADLLELAVLQEPERRAV